jgi:hypothetical protein
MVQIVYEQQTKITPAFAERVLPVDNTAINKLLGVLLQPEE